ncbi:CRISPR-associated helicase/endonuclease Cas3 [Methanococcus voltae]|uniref:CRISPR-associated helicase Cas3 n=1 Tax=Methanococcus voltae (strain ATCC BAA-1334 / A3) TaxID=456320 RepID=D7DSV9_METV3|nr:CRISPR-associated helicase/endonuclease Cas3 [Methanococcus voltae]MCS3901891.1 CRISPR-associated endonuclease/helicase Cas3 [Methanococcus voltae]
MLFAKSKPFETLYDHSINTYNTGIKIINNLPFDDEIKRELKNNLTLPLLFHDIGKSATGFQDLLTKNKKWGKRHEILSALFLKKFDLSDEQIFSVLMHHKYIPENNLIDLSSRYFKYDIILPYDDFDDDEEEDEGYHETYLKMIDEFNQNIEEITILSNNLLNYINYPKNSNNLDYKLSAKEILSKKWFYANNDVNKWNNQLKNMSYDSRYLAALYRGILMSADHLASGHIEIPEMLKNMENYHILKEGHQKRPFQNKCENCTNNLMLVAPTGSGKTEAVLLWLKNNFKPYSRVFYVLPYTASINAMHQRLSLLGTSDGKITNVHNIGVLHSNSLSYYYGLLEDMDEDNKNDNKKYTKDSEKDISKLSKMASELSSLSREMYYQFRVCTPHQLLRFSLRGRGWEFFLSEFQNSIIIYDEIHAFQPKLAGLTISTAKLLTQMGAKVAFMSATFPEFLKEKIKENIPDIEEINLNEDDPADRKILDKKRHKINVVSGNILDNLDMSYILELLNDNKKILIIANTVRTAQKIYEMLDKYLYENSQKYYELTNKANKANKSNKSNKYSKNNKNNNKNYDEGNDILMLLHSRFNKKDRKDKEKRLIIEDRTLLPDIVVSTQVIEVSLDIDYDVMFTEPAPMDALAQRFGRVNRKGEREPANIFIFSNQNSKIDIYNSERVQNTVYELEKIAKSSKNVLSEMNLLEIVNTIYKNGYNEEEERSFTEGLNYKYLVNFKETMVAGVGKDWVDELIDNSQSRCQVLPLEDRSEFDRLIENNDYIHARDLLVDMKYNMISNSKVIEKLKKSNAYVVDCEYNSKIGINLTKESNSNNCIL